MLLSNRFNEAQAREVPFESSKSAQANCRLTHVLSSGSNKNSFSLHAKNYRLSAETMKDFPAQQFKEWFKEQQRDLPWRQEPRDPYHVWISEVMLQQTQVAVVMPYYERWLNAFPTIEALANAKRDQVIKLWEGLGYYSRARNLHEAAQYLLAHHQGKLPPDALDSVKGIGPYTKGAILSFAFHQKTAAVDGNVLRVLARYYALDNPIDLPKTRKEITQLAEQLLPDQEPWVVAEGLIELGATLCTKKAKCQECPLRKSCQAYRHGRVDQLPKKSKRVAVTELKRTVGIISCQDHYLLVRGESGKVMADLFEFPYIEETEHVQQAFEKHLDLTLKYIKPLAVEKHTFTRYRVQLLPHILEASEMDRRYHWQEKSKLATLPFSSGHRRILGRL